MRFKWLFLVAAAGSILFGSTPTLAGQLAPPTELMATASSGSRVDLSWLDTNRREKGYRIDRSLQPDGGFSRLFRTGRNVTCYQDLSVVAGVTYYYRIRAAGAKPSAWSNVVNVTPGSDLMPAAPMDLTANGGPNRIDVSWTDDSDNETGFRLERSLSAGGPFDPIAYTAPDVTSFSDKRLAPSTYYYRVVSYNGSGESASSNVVSAKTGKSSLSTPTGLTVTDTTPDSVSLAWSGNSSNQTSFTVERAVSESGPWGQVYASDSIVSSYTDTGLADDATYYYRVSTSNSETSSAYSNAASARTQRKIPAAPSNLSAASSSSSQIDLTWTDSSRNENGFNIERSSSSSGPFSQIGVVGANVTSYSDTGLSPSSTWFYRVNAYNSAGNSGYSNTASATTQTTQGSIPVSPSNLTATAASSSQINLSWTDNSSSEDGFKVERCAGSGCTSFAQVATVGANVTSYSDTGLGSAATYSYRVKAYNSTGDSGYSNTASATTQDTAPAAPSNLTATAVSSSQVNLAWTDNSGNESGFKVERCTGSGCTSFAQVATVGANVVSYSDAGLSSLTSYSYRVKAYNGVGDSAYSSTASATTQDTPPTAPSSLTATAASSSQINLAWTDNSGNESGFKVERCTGSGCTSFVQIGTVGANVTSYSDTGLSPAATCSYRVRAYNSMGDSGYSNTASATTQDTVPAAPSNLTATAASASQINLSWTDNSSNESGFKIERCTGSGCTSFAQVGTVGVNVATYSDTGLGSSTTYSYRVKAWNSIGDSGYSNTASATTQGTAPAAPSNLTASAASSSQINLSWTDNSSNETGFKVERCTGSGCTSFAQITTVGANVVSYSDMGLSSSTSYSYRVRSYNSVGDSGYSNSSSATTQACSPPSAPSNLTTTSISTTQINLSWTDNSSNESGFKVERCTGSGCTNFAQIATLGANYTTYSDGGLSAGTTYNYRIRSYSSSCGDSAYSNTASATTKPDTTPPSVPTGLTATAASCSQVNLTWNASSDESGGSGLAGYKVYRGGVQIATTTTTSYSDTSVSASTSYTYKVASYDNAGNISAQSSSSSATTPACGGGGAHIWSMRSGGPTPNDSAYGKGIATDGSGNVIIAGYFQGGVDFGGGTLTSSSSYANDIFVAKYSSSGAHLWSKRFGASTDDEGYGVAVDSNGNVVVTGYFEGSVDFGGGPITSAGMHDIFVAKFSSTGAHLWSKRFGSTSNDIGYAVAVDGSGNVIVTGYFVGTVDFGGGPLTSAGGADIFLAKFSPDGTHLWSKRFGGTTSDVGQAVGVDSSGNIVVTGYFKGTADFGGGALTSAGNNDIFVAKYSASGVHQWSKRFGDTLDDLGYGVALDSGGNVVVTGTFNGTVDFGGGPFVNSAGADDIFLVKYSSSGAHLWSRQFSGTLSFGEAPRGVAVDGSGNVALTGAIISDVNFGGGILTSNGTYDIFIAKFDSMGTHLWSRRFYANWDDHGNGVTTDSSGNVLITGDFWESVDFGGGPLNSPGGVDSFISKFAP